MIVRVRKIEMPSYEVFKISAPEDFDTLREKWIELDKVEIFGSGLTVFKTLSGVFHALTREHGRPSRQLVIGDIVCLFAKKKSIGDRIRETLEQHDILNFEDVMTDIESVLEEFDSNED